MSAYSIIIALSVLGIANTIYLSWHSVTKKPVKCIGFPKKWCKKVQYSKFSKTFGIPNGFLGLAIYALILILTVQSNTNNQLFEYVTYLIYLGFAFSMYFLFIQAFVLRAFCTWCVLSTVEFTLLLLTIIYLL